MYTKIPNTQCDGWAYTSFEDCKQKCINNALPESCDSGESSKNCAFAVWDDNADFAPGWCQLAEDGVCNKENTQPWGEQVKIWEKTGKTMISRQRFEHISKGSPFLPFQNAGTVWAMVFLFKRINENQNIKARKLP